MSSNSMGSELPSLGAITAGSLNNEPATPYLVTDGFGFDPTALDSALIPPPMGVPSYNPLEELERKQEEERRRLELEREEAERRAYNGDSDKQIELPTGTWSDSSELLSKANVDDMLERGSQVEVKKVTDGEEFELPAMLLDLSKCESIYPICLDGIKSFSHSAPEKQKCNIYVRNSAGQIFTMGSGDINELSSEFPDYVQILFGENAVVKNIVQGDDGAFKLKKLTNGIKAFKFNLNYAF